MKIVRLAETGSTNTVARELYDYGEREPLWVVAERQLSGRGRLDRHWVSEPGNVYASALIPKPDAPAGAAAFIAAVTVAETLRDFTDKERIALKWPNDALLDGHKVSGVLCEAVDEHVICGIGINVAHHPDETRWPATHLASANAEATAELVFERLQLRFEDTLTLLQRQKWDAVRGAWLDYAYGLGSEVAVETGGKRVAGRIRGLGPNGELLLSTPSGTVPIVAGDVTYRS